MKKQFEEMDDLKDNLFEYLGKIFEPKNPKELTPFEKDLKLGKWITLNGKLVPYYKYQLPCHKRDLGLWSKGIKINGAFKVTDYKIYYGIKGKDGKAVLKAFMEQVWNKYMSV